MTHLRDAFWLFAVSLAGAAVASPPPHHHLVERAGACDDTTITARDFLKGKFCARPGEKIRLAMTESGGTPTPVGWQCERSHGAPSTIRSFHARGEIFSYRPKGTSGAAESWEATLGIPSRHFCLRDAKTVIFTVPDDAAELEVWPGLVGGPRLHPISIALCDRSDFTPHAEEETRCPQ